jgi:hypothetical protein
MLGLLASQLLGDGPKAGSALLAVCCYQAHHQCITQCLHRTAGGWTSQQHK